MAYSKKNHLLRVKSVIAVYLKFKTDGNTTTYVYREYIYPAIILVWQHCIII